MDSSKTTKEGMKNLLRAILPAPVSTWRAETEDRDDWVEFTKELASDHCWAQDTFIVEVPDPTQEGLAHGFLTRDEATSLRDWLTEQLEAK